MLIGIVGAPNKGKSTLFSAMTMNDVAIADYPFTTIKPNFGVAYATKKCVHEELKVKCNARNSLCVNGTRMFPVNVVDVAGLVEGAHEGKGMGNQFLNDLSAADALILVVDASGKTDATGNKTDDANPVDDVEMVVNELVEWLSGLIKKHMPQISRSKNNVDSLHDVLTSLKVTKEEIDRTAASVALSTSKINWKDDEIRKFATALIKKSKPYIIAANKTDVNGAKKNVDVLKKKFGEKSVIGCSGAMELALRKAAKSNAIEYTPGSNSFTILEKDSSQEKLNAIKYMQEFLKQQGTNVQELVNATAFGLFDNIVVYPVEDENKYTDGSGNVLPDAILIKRGSTALQLAEKIHTDIAKRMLYAIDARTKMKLSKDHVLKDNDIINIVSAAK